MTKAVKCDECGGSVKATEVPFSLHGELLGSFEAEVCGNCGEKVFSEETADKIDKTAMQKGLWNLSSRTKVAKVGTSLGVTLSKRIANFARLSKGREVIIYPENKKKIVIEILE